MDKPIITVGIPVLNEEKSIDSCVRSILAQTYPKDRMNVYFADGGSTDKTRKILLEYHEKYPELITLLDNPDKIAPTAMNICIDRMKGDYFVRLDAHSDYPGDYIEKCIETIMTVDADNVGGLAENIGVGTVGEAFAQVLSSKFGVGNSGFRTGAKSGYVDTVPFGTFKRSTFQKYGKFDRRLCRNQDNEINFRIRKHGGKVYLSSEIALNYHCRNSFLSIMKNALQNGEWNVITMKLCPGSMGLRHFIPLLFLLSLIVMPISVLLFSPFKWLFAAELAVYSCLNLVFSLQNTDPKYKNHFWIKLFLFPLFHLSYGAGSLKGLARLPFIKK